jgi:hypothetical protein
VGLGGVGLGGVGFRGLGLGRLGLGGLGLVLARPDARELGCGLGFGCLGFDVHG